VKSVFIADLQSLCLLLAIFSLRQAGIPWRSVQFIYCRLIFAEEKRSKIIYTHTHRAEFKTRFQQNPNSQQHRGKHCRAAMTWVNKYISNRRPPPRKVTIIAASAPVTREKRVNDVHTHARVDLLLLIPFSNPQLLSEKPPSTRGADYLHAGWI